MDFKAVLLRSFIFFLLFILSFTFACSTPSWFSIKKGPPHRAKMKELLDKEVIIVDGEEYVKVLNPRASEGREGPKYLYIPVEEYLSKKESFITSAIRKEEVSKGFPLTPMKSAPAEIEREVSVSSTRPSRELKKKVVIAHFDDRTNHSDEVFGDWVAEKLIKEISRRSRQILFVDYKTVYEFLKRNGIALKDLETPPVLRSIHEVFGIHAVVVGELSGPYLFATKAAKDQEETALAIIKVETKVMDASSGNILKTLSSSNPILATKERGFFSEEKAKMKAIDLAISSLGQSLAKELDELDWFCRVAKVEGEEVYINAGRLTGLKMGDVMEVLRQAKPGEHPEVKARLRIGAWFGMDGSIGKLIEGEQPEANDILKMARTFSDTESGK